MRCISTLGTGMLVLALVAAPAALAQKWVDEKGRVYYGDKPKGVNVKPAEMKGGGVGTYSTEDLSKKLQERADAKSAQAKLGPKHVGRPAEYKVDMPRGGPQNRESLR
jgi:Domain of unknown function (DUF4124)